jgi:hypothetical protein
MNRGLVDDIVAVVLGLSTSLLVLGYILIAVLKYHYYKFWLWLLILIEVGAFSFAVQQSLYFQKDHSDNTLPHRKDNIGINLLGAVHQISINVVHWIFAMKYWVLACKLQALHNNLDPHQHNKRFQVIYVVGLIINVVAGVAYACPAELALVIAFIVLPLQICILISCVLLADAFRRLR